MTVKVKLYPDGIGYSLTGASKIIVADVDDILGPKPTIKGGSADDILDLSMLDTGPLGVSLTKANLTAEHPWSGEDVTVKLQSIEHIVGSAYADRISGSGARNILIGDLPVNLPGTNGAGDVLSGRGGDDELYGVYGDDQLEGGKGSDLLSGGAGVDRAVYRSERSGVVVDLVDSSRNSGAAKGDRLISIENVEGSGFSDRIYGSSAVNVLLGGAGHDRLEGKGGADHLEGDNGNDVLVGGDGSDVLFGGSGVDQYVGGGGTDTAILMGSQGRVVVSLSNSSKNAGAAKGEVFSSIENLIGTSESDVLEGDGKANWLTGYLGDDRLTGHGGADVFQFWTASQSQASKVGNDVITDFSSAENDRIDLRGIDSTANDHWQRLFRFIGDEAFSGEVDDYGELRFEIKHEKTYVYGDVNGDGQADLKIVLLGEHALSKGDFML